MHPSSPIVRNFTCRFLALRFYRKGPKENDVRARKKIMLRALSIAKAVLELPAIDPALRRELMSARKSESWFIYESYDGLWLWERLNSMGNIIERSKQRFASREICVSDAKANGYSEPLDTRTHQNRLRVRDSGRSPARH